MYEQLLYVGVVEETRGLTLNSLYNHTTCISRWKDVETIVSMSFERGVSRDLFVGHLLIFIVKLSIDSIFLNSTGINCHNLVPLTEINVL